MKFTTNIETNIDELFILTEDLNIYILPIEEINNKSTLNICSKYEKFRVNKKNNNFNTENK